MLMFQNRRKTRRLEVASSDTKRGEKSQKNALLTFAGEQDTEFFAAALKAISEMSADECGGSRELSVRAEGDRIIIGYKKELDI